MSGPEVVRDFTNNITLSLSDMNEDGAFTFSDFVEEFGHEYGPHFDQKDIEENPQFMYGTLQHAQSYALASAAIIDELDENSVSINQTVNTAYIVLAEQDLNDPTRGSIHYIAFAEGSAQRTHVFTEQVSVHPDGTFRTEMDGAFSWDMMDTLDRNAYERLVDKFASAAQSNEGQELVNGIENTGRELPVGGVSSHAGEVEIRHTLDSDGRPSSVSAASASILNDTTVLEIQSQYDASGNASMLLNVFRQAAEGIVESQGVTAGVDNQAKYDKFSNISPGVLNIGG